MELTNEHWKELGYNMKTSNGGYNRWYHNVHLGDNFIFYDNGASISQGYLSFNVDDKRNPKTLGDLARVTFRAIGKAMEEYGRKAQANSIKELLYLED